MVSKLMRNLVINQSWELLNTRECESRFPVGMIVSQCHHQRKDLPVDLASVIGNAPA